MKGIDVSYAQGKIDWKQVALNNVQFAMIKASQGRLQSNANSGSFVDPQFDDNMKGAYANGIKIGVYHYLTATNVSEAYKEAKYFLRIIEPYRNKIDLYAAVDVEEDKYLPKDKSILTECINVFCDTIKRMGYSPMVYTNPNYIRYKLDDISQWDLWLAYWGVAENFAQQYNPVIWQYGLSHVNGIVGNVDSNMGYFAEKEDVTELPENNDIDDVQQDNEPADWAKDGVEWMVENELMYGDENGNLMLNSPLTRQQFCVLLHRYHERFGK